MLCVQIVRRAGRLLGTAVAACAITTTFLAASPVTAQASAAAMTQVISPAANGIRGKASVDANGIRRADIQRETDDQTLTEVSSRANGI